MTEKRNWLKNPTGKETLLVFSAWLVSSMLTLTAASNFFTENPVRHSNIAVSSISIVATVITAAAVINYFKNRRRSA